jgi:hypothetical protein
VLDRELVIGVGVKDSVVVRVGDQWGKGDQWGCKLHDFGGNRRIRSSGRLVSGFCFKDLLRVEEGVEMRGVGLARTFWRRQ